MEDFGGTPWTILCSTNVMSHKKDNAIVSKIGHYRSQVRLHGNLVCNGLGLKNLPSLSFRNLIVSNATIWKWRNWACRDVRANLKLKDNIGKCNHTTQEINLWRQAKGVIQHTNHMRPQQVVKSIDMAHSCSSAITDEYRQFTQPQQKWSRNGKILESKRNDDIGAFNTFSS